MPFGFSLQGGEVYPENEVIRELPAAPHPIVN
jgi:hypothetical protein